MAKYLGAMTPPKIKTLSLQYAGPKIEFFCDISYYPLIFKKQED